MFRRQKTVKQLSADELKSKLYARFEKTGSLNRMRSELRGKLVSELFKIAPPMEPSDTNPDAKNFEKALLPLQVCNWLVYDHLLRQGHQYALSTFVSEANLPHPERLLTACDILSLFGLDSTTPEYRTISRMYIASGEQGLLHSLLLAVIKCLFNFGTDEGDGKYTSGSNENKGARLDEKCVKISPDHASRTRDEPRDQPRDKSWDYSALYGSDAGVFSGQKKGLSESNLQEQLQFIKEEKEREIQGLRHKLVTELDRLHAQERKVQLEINDERIEMKKERSTLLLEKEKLREKERVLDKEYGNKLEKKIKEMEADFQSKIYSKEKEVEEFREKLYEKEQRLMQKETDFSTQQSSHDILKKELEYLRDAYKSTQKKYFDLLDENTNLIREFKSVSDYAALKGELETKSKEMANLQRETEELHRKAEKDESALAENIRNLESKLKVKDTELLEAQKQLNLTRNTLRMEETEWGKERRKLEQETQSSRDMYRTLIQRLEEQKEDIQALHQTIHVLHYQLTNKDTQNRSRVEQPSTFRRNLFRIQETPKQDAENFRVGSFKDSPPRHRMDSLKFLEEARDRISRLQQEADVVQDKYSMIYSSECDFKNIPSSTFAWNAASATQPFSSVHHPTRTYSADHNSSHLENLIRNEMPILDLSFPSPIKDQIASALADIYASPPPKSYPSTSSPEHAFCKPSISRNLSESRRADFTLTSPSRNNESSSLSERLGNQEDLTSEQHESIFQKTVPRHLDTRTTTHTEIGRSENMSLPLHIDRLTGPNEQLQHRTNEDLAQSSDKYSPQTLPERISSIPKEVPPVDVINTDQSYLLSSKEIDAKSNSDSSLMLELKDQVLPPTDQPNVLKDNLAHLQESKPLPPTDQQDALKGNLAHLQESKPSSPTDQQTVLKDNLAHLQESKPLPAMGTHFVDLEAAWKTRSYHAPPSLPSLGPGLFRSSTLIEDSNDKNNPGATIPEMSQTATEAKVVIPSERIETAPSPQNPDLNAEDNAETQNSGRDLESSRSQLTGSDLDEPKRLQEKNAESGDVLEHSDRMNTVIKDSAKILDDSLSELSELHLSCGSEQEQQKEDSDNW